MDWDVGTGTDLRKTARSVFPNPNRVAMPGCAYDRRRVIAGSVSSGRSLFVDCASESLLATGMSALSMKTLAGA